MARHLQGSCRRDLSKRGLEAHAIGRSRGGRTARVWDAATGAQILRLEGHEGGVNSAAFSPDGTRIVTASDDGTARVWDAATGAQVQELGGHEHEVTTAAFSPDGTRIVTASDLGTARVRDAATGAQILGFDGHEDWVLSAAFSPDGARIVTALGDGTARVWDVATGAAILQFEGDEGRVQGPAFAPDGLQIITVSEEGVRSAAFSPDGTRIVTASEDGTARVWDALTLEELVDRAKEQVARTRPLSPAQECQCPSPRHPARRVVNMKAAQVGATKAGNHWIGFCMHRAPGQLRAVQPTVDLAKRLSKRNSGSIR